MGSIIGKMEAVKKTSGVIKTSVKNIKRMSDSFGTSARYSGKKLNGQSYTHGK